MSATTLCHGCGQRLNVPADYPRNKMRCPECGVMCDVPPPEERKSTPKPAARRPAPASAPAAKPSPPPAPKNAVEDDLPIPLMPEPEPPPRPQPDIEFSDDPDDGKPYRVTAKEPQCPQCGLRLGPEETECPTCGCDLKTGKKPKRSYEPAELSWEAGLSLHRRQLLFMLGVVLGIALGVPIAISTESWTGAVLSWIVFIALSAFLLGTYPRVELTRNKRGKVTLAKIWRVCFIERPPINFEVTEFQGVRTGYASDVSVMDWIIAFLLLPSIVLAILWWYIFIQRDQHTVTLVREHGYGSDVLYRGVSEEMAKEIASALEDVGGLPYENR